EKQFNTWIRRLQAVEEGRVLRLLAPNRFVVEWLQEHYIQRILELVDGAGGGSEVVIEVGSRAAAAGNERVPAPQQAPRGNTASVIVSRRNPSFTFTAFVEGKSNQLAKAAATQVGVNPGRSYNPL